MRPSKESRPRSERFYALEQVIYQLTRNRKVARMYAIHYLHSTAIGQLYRHREAHFAIMKYRKKEFTEEQREQIDHAYALLYL